MSATGGLLQAAAGGDQSAWNALWVQHTGLLWSVARSYRLDGAEAADVVQTTWMRLVEHVDRIEDPARLVGWLVTTARRESMQLQRRVSRERLTLDEDAAAEIPDSDAEPVEARLITTERNALLRRAFTRLSERDQQLLRLLVAAPNSYAAVAAEMQVSVGSIGPLRQRALTRLRAHLDEEDTRTAAAAQQHAAAPSAASGAESTKLAARPRPASSGGHRATHGPLPAAHRLDHHTRPAELTAQEERLLQRVRTGRTNTQIAEEFGLHVKTVEYHLHKIYRKLGIARRTQLAPATTAA